MQDACLSHEPSEGHRFDSCWEHSDFSFDPSMPVSLTEKHHLSILIIVSCYLSKNKSEQSGPVGLCFIITPLGEKTL